MKTWKWGDIVIAPNKSFEWQFEFGKDSNFHPFEFKFCITHKQDHAGVSFTFGILNVFWMRLNTYDHRHWNHQKNRWAEPGDVDEDEDDE